MKCIKQKNMEQNTNHLITRDNRTSNTKNKNNIFQDNKSSGHSIKSNRCKDFYLFVGGGGSHKRIKKKTTYFIE